MADTERTLRKALIKLAYDNPELRPTLLPLVAREKENHDYAGLMRNQAKWLEQAYKSGNERKADKQLGMMLTNIAQLLRMQGAPTYADRVGKIGVALFMMQKAGSDVGKTILEQMGGIGRLRAMTGAKDFVTYPDGVAFKFPNRQRSKGNYVKVVWNRGPDDYTMEFQNLTSTSAKKVKTYKNIGVEQLIELFQKQTGLFLRL